MTAMGYAPQQLAHDGCVRPAVDPPVTRVTSGPAPPLVVLAAQSVAVVAAAPLIVWLVPAGPARVDWWTAVLVALVIAAGTAAVQARARSAAYRAGCAAERARLLRSLHDTALQSLETMALAADADRVAPAEALTELRGTARRQAALLRRSLGEVNGAGPGHSLVALLGEVVDEAPADGPRIELIAGADLPEPAPWRRECLRDATREALVNVVKHAAARHVVVRVAAAADGVEVVIRDDGRGFAPERTTPGFGTRQSITARVREAGGDAGITSRPGGGTRVRLWMPARLTTTPRRRRPRR
ncbi:sensor histidine kinase [Actinoplanes sp. NPDC049599]|uniref:sensor histidine kinase n=1 Tax=Actinoplanes sp. NPDC049599 TaxID=3363903 RepID=UPI0037887687